VIFPSAGRRWSRQAAFSEPASTAQISPIVLGMAGEASSSTARAISAGSIKVSVSIPPLAGIAAGTLPCHYTVRLVGGVTRSDVESSARIGSSRRSAPTAENGYHSGPSWASLLHIRTLSAWGLDEQSATGSRGQLPAGTVLFHADWSRHQAAAGRAR
jgi:hypothetical protein